MRERQLESSSHALPPKRRATLAAITDNRRMTIQRRTRKDGTPTYRVLVYDPAIGRKRTIGTYTNQREARREERNAQQAIEAARHRNPDGLTVTEWRDRWLTEHRPAKDSTVIHYRERTREFIHAHGHLPVAIVDRRTVNAYLAGRAGRAGQVPTLRAMFYAAQRRDLIDVNPFANLGLTQSRGNRDKNPPSIEQVELMIANARRLTPPSYASWLKFATETGLRPGELDALQWADVDLAAEEAHIRRQFNAKLGRLDTLKKHGQRTVALTAPALDTLLSTSRESEWVFTTLRGSHYTPSSRSYHWKAVRGATTGLDGKSLYLCTRHFAGWFMVNVLELESAVVAHQLGHEDGGRLVERLYGHRERGRSRDAIRAAYRRATVTPLRAVSGKEA